MAINNFQIENEVLVKYRGSDAQVVIPNGVTTIGERAFEGNKTLKNVIIPASVTVIKKAAFSGCSSLQSVSMADGVEIIEDSAFYKNQSLKKLVLSKKLKHIGDSAFGNCKKLSSVVLPDSVEFVGDGAFSIDEGLKELTLGPVKVFGCAWPLHLKKITYTGDLAGWVNMKRKSKFYCFHCGVYFTNKSLVNAVIPEGTTSIAGFEFNKTVKSLTIPDSVTCIGEYTFLKSEIETVVIGNGVTDIAPNAFFNCKVKNVTFKNKEGWSVISKKDPTDKGDVLSSNLASPVMAANYLTKVYLECFWKRS